LAGREGDQKASHSRATLCAPLRQQPPLQLRARDAEFFNGLLDRALLVESFDMAEQYCGRARESASGVVTMTTMAAINAAMPMV
jgi:hypothetical protein